ncbi:MAG: hypothetical protein AAF664_06295 [Planctomycetota bacterium]
MLTRQEMQKKLQQATTLLNQQCWCWGRDRLHPEGNYLVETGFERIEPPNEFKDCSSVYQLRIGDDQQIILRGFGVFFGQLGLGGVFLPRFEFSPLYSSTPELACPPWTQSELAQLRPPNSHNRIQCGLLLLGLVDWIRQYEVDLVERLGIEFRRAAISDWKSKENRAIPAESVAAEWRRLSFDIGENADIFLSGDPIGESSFLN